MDDGAFEDLRTGRTAPRPPDAGPGLALRALMRFFDPTLASDFSDSDSSFFGTYRRLFERLAQEEAAAAAHADEDPGARVEYPSFGYSHTPWLSTGEEHQTPVRNFYQAWTGFASRKSFAWMDQYRLNDAPDRRVKR